MLKIKISLFIGFIICLQSTLASEFRCPDSIQTTQTLYSQLDPDLKSRFDPVGTAQTLESISIIDGQGPDAATVAADPDKEGKGPAWNFTRKKVRSLWLCCSYGQTKIQVLKELPAPVRKCSIKYKPNSKRIDSLNCS